jgi:phenylpropionate dioxygenase-like ring-hydroxylating dioxygenase large terminal subunit
VISKPVGFFLLERGMAEYVRNLWYMAAWQDEVDRVPMLARTLLDDPWLIYRTQDDQYAMIFDRCPHRFAPLSRGTRSGDSIACGYHGLTFDQHGHCVRNPFSKVIPRNAAVPTRRTVARYGILWFWAGEPELADTSTIPDFAFLDDPAPMTRKKTWMKANYELLTDNLMDLSHVEFIHANSFRSGGAMFSGTHRGFEGKSGEIWSCWSMTNVPAPRFAPSLSGQRVDRWTNMRWNAPACMYLEVGATPTGQPREQSPVPPLRNPHIVTPESATTSHYFYNCVPGEESEAFAERVFDQEDRPMLEAIQERMRDRDFWALRPVMLKSDSGAIRARQELQRLRQLESGSSMKNVGPASLAEEEEYS